MPATIHPQGSVAPFPDQVIGSASADSSWINIHETTAPGTLLHKGSASGVLWDAVTILAANNDTTAHTLTMVWATDDSTPDLSNTMTVKLQPQNGFKLIVDRFRLQRTRPVYAYADTPDVTTCYVEIGRL